MSFNPNSLSKQLDWKWDGDLDKKHDRVYERILHDEEFGEENVELVDSEWADFERALRLVKKKQKDVRVILVIHFRYFILLLNITCLVLFV